MDIAKELRIIQVEAEPADTQETSDIDWIRGTATSSTLALGPDEEETG